MPFPLKLTVNMKIQENQIQPNFDLHFNSGCITVIGPNASGKTQILRGIKQSINSIISGKQIRFLSSGRIGLFEQYRSDYDGNRGNNLRYKNADFGSKSDSSRRHKYETIQGDFQTLSVRPDILVKVQERLKKLFNRSIFIEWDAGYLKALFKKNDSNKEPYSSAQEASGLLHLVAILSSLYDDEIGALILDEPEVSLHPQLQSFLIKEIEKYAGTVDNNKKLIIIATHSTEFIKIHKPLDLTNICFYNQPNINPIQLSPDAEELKSKKLNELLSRMGQEHKISFFSRRPLLVEGLSDSIICNGIERKMNLYLEASGAQILPIIGKGQFPVVFNFFKLIGKEPIILADGDSFTDNMDICMLFCNSEIANVLSQKNGFSDLADFIKKTHNDFCKIADDEVNNLKELLESTNYWKNQDSGADPKKVYRRALLSLLFSSEQSNIEVIQASDRLESIKTRLESLFDILEKSGCFILRKGTIEEYYNFSSPSTSIGKPSAAIKEMEKLYEKDVSFLTTNYGEIARCLQYTSKTKEINEIESLRELLLAILAPVLASLNSTSKQADIDSIIRNILGERGKLFKIELTDGDSTKVSVDINSSILEVNCFPFEIMKDENLVKTIDNKLGFK